MDATDTALAARLAAGEPEAFAHLYAEHGARLYGYLYSATGRREMAEDLLQSVWLRLVRYRRRLGRVENLRAYLFTVARNEVRRRGTSGQAQRTAEEVPDAAGPRSSGADDDGAALRRAVANLSPTRREVVALKAWHHLTFTEIGTVLSISPNTVASRYRLALQDLRSMLRETVDAPR